MSGRELVLASASPRRRDLLARVGVRFEVIAPDIDEGAEPGEDPAAYVRRVALAKAMAVWKTFPNRAVLAADTIVEKDGEIFGKPSSRAEAEQMLSRLLGASHRVTTAFALAFGEVRHLEAVTTVVRMRRASAEELAGYLASGEWNGKAGAYAIQGIAGALVTAVDGSVTNVIGLPLAEVVAALASTGAARVDFASGVPA